MSPPTAIPARWIAAGLLVPALAWDASGLDLAMARWSGNALGFPLREHWLLVGVLHEGGRALAWLSVLGLGVMAAWPRGPFARVTLRARIQLAGTALLASLVVVALKHASHTSCPWDLAEFGGVAAHVSHWRSATDGGGGRCFPAGHASAGFAFVGGYFAFRPVDVPLAHRWLAGALGAGLLLGVAQQLRGAHFMSHTLWTAVVCWAVAWTVDALMRPLTATVTVP